MLNFKVIAVATVVGWLAVITGKLAHLFPPDPPTSEVER